METYFQSYNSNLLNKMCNLLHQQQNKIQRDKMYTLNFHTKKSIFLQSNLHMMYMTRLVLHKFQVHMMNKLLIQKK